MIHDFGLETRDGSTINLGLVREHFQDSFRRVWLGELESDGFNALVLRAGLAWRQVVVLRALCKYLRQAGIPFSQIYMEETLAHHPNIARLIVDLFLTLFDIDESPERGKRADSLRAKLKESLDAVVSADEDRILRRYVNVVESMLRTNFFQRSKDGEYKPYLSFKLDSSKIEDLPLPKPLREIFVYSPRMEGIHLRFGMVARGGLRWSDRREDFRTEILGLVKAQQVKNAVIVPVGSKGGFVVKRPPASGDREAVLKEGIACYQTLIRGLLDLTDNLKGGAVAPPTDVIRRDGDDPYLVVAADKGTATFSDIANAISGDYGFWLGDAFASGGSQGYDHKKMGITARGAWESVKRHFREIGVNVQEEDFTVVGVGDMSGDVFGNGLLQSRHIKLVGAFNHMHIFIDPSPDPAKSFAERKRLFDLPRSAWSDYDAKLISKGGGVFERKAKSLTLSPEIKKLFGIAKDQVTPNELINAMLKADVDLLFFGGIGTYVKASTESHGEAGDRTNDAIRVNGGQLRAKVVGEGANLGMTQRGRIEYALAGGRLNTDSIDNSAGVDCSDHEVNIKILVDSVVAAGDLTVKQRNELLVTMTDEVGELVLRDNYLQTQAISMVESKGVAVLDNQARLMRMLERAGRLNRAVEFLPDDETLAERAQAKKGLTRPENAILMSYAKIWLYDELLPFDLPDDPYLAEDLIRYFPTPLRERFKDAAGRHRLRREIIATAVTNSLVNRVGGTFVAEFMEKTGMKAPDIARAYIIARQVLDLRTLWQQIEALDNKVPAQVQIAMLYDINHLLEWTTLWFLRNGRRPLDLGSHIDEFADGMAALAAAPDDVLPAHYLADLRTRAKPYIEKGVPESLACRIAGLVNLFSGCDIVRLASRRQLPVPYVAKLYYAIGTRFRLGRLRAAADGLESTTHWQKLAIAALVEEIYGHQLALAHQVLDFAGPGMVPSETVIKGWVDKNAIAVQQAEQLLSELWTTPINDLSMIAVASRQLRALAQASAAA
jgi:glutamate dehydrogenase